MSAVDDAIERAENDPPAESWRPPMAQVVGDREVLAAEVKRLRAGLVDIARIGAEMQKMFDAYWAAR